MTHTSTATVVTDRSSRWSRQLLDHLGRKAEVRPAADGGAELLLAGGSCVLVDGPDALLLSAAAPDVDALARVEQVVGGHLERFAAREGLTVAWQRG